MFERDASSQSAEITRIGSGLSDLAAQVERGQTRVAIERDGVPGAALVSLADLAALNRLDRTPGDVFDEVGRVREAFADVPADEIERETDRIIERIRAENRAERGQTADRR